MSLWKGFNTSSKTHAVICEKVIFDVAMVGLIIILGSSSSWNHEAHCLSLLFFNFLKIFLFLIFKSFHCPDPNFTVFHLNSGHNC